jgi:PAS domain S-box-containing protein
MIAVCVVAGGAGIVLLYRTAYTERLHELRGAAETLAAFMDSAAHFDRVHSASAHPPGERGATLSHIEAGLKHVRSPGSSKELLIGELSGSGVRVMRSTREGGIEYVTDVAGDSELAEPLGRALRGERGSGELRDYRGVRVLAGYAPVPALDVAVVYKVDLAEMRAPYVRAAWWASMVALLASMLGAWILVNRVRPLERRVREEQAFSNAVLENAGALVVVLDREGRIRRFNRACETLSGYRFAEIEGRFPWETVLPPDSAESTRQNAFEAAVRDPTTGTRRYVNEWLTRSGERRHTEWFNTLLLGARGEVQYMVSIGNDITEARRARDEVEQSRARLRNILDSLFGFVGVYSLDGRLVDANEAPMRAAGLRREDAIGQFFWDTYWWNYSGQVQAQLKDALRRASRGELVRYDVAVRIKDGAFITIDVQFGPLRDASGAIVQVIGFAVDVTQRKLAEEGMRLGRAGLLEAQRIAHLGSWDLDLVDGRLLWSEEIYRIFEIDPERFGASYEAFLEVVHPGDRAAVDRAYTESVHDRTPYEISHRLCMPDGRIKWVRERGETHYDEDGKPLRSVGTVQDITDLHLAQDTIARSEQHMRLLLDSLPFAVGYIDMAERITYANQLYRKQYGAGSDPVGRQLRDVLDEGVYDTYRHHILQALAGESVQYERAFVHADGAPCIRLARYVPDLDASGRVAGFFALIEDITERRRTESRIRAGLAEKEVLLKEVYHRVKNNLQVVSSLLNMQGRVVTDPAARDLFAESANRVKSMALVHELLYRAPDLSSISLAQYLDQLAGHLALAHRPLSARVLLAVEGADLKVGIEAAVPLGLIANELITNAYKHAYPPDTPDGRVLLSLELQAGGRMRLGVTDDGRGLPAKFSIENATTLGMQLVLALTRQLGGELRCESRGGRTRFEVSFRPEARQAP